MASSPAAISMRFPSPRTLVVARASSSKPRKQLSSKKPSNNKKKNLNSIRTTAPPPFFSDEVTRLPIKDENFFLDEESPTEIKLKQQQKLSSSSRKDKTHNEEEEEEDVGFDGKVNRVYGEDEEYGRYELIEITSDNEFDDDDDYYDDDFDDEEEGKEERKKKGVPAVMRCFDRAKIYVKAGDGGNGVVAFRREKYVPFGGPSGGDGGRGGNVYMEVDDSMTSLLPFRQSIHFRAGRGSHGQGSKMSGAKGDDVVVKVPAGTVVRVAETDGVEGEVLLEFLQSGDRALLLPGGRGGRGNASFKSGINKVPKIAENGEEGSEM